MGGLELLERLITTNEQARDDLRKRISELEQLHVPPDGTFPARMWRDGRFETKAEALERTRKELASQEEALAAYVDAKQRVIAAAEGWL